MSSPTHGRLRRVWRSPVLDVAAGLIALVRIIWIAVLLPSRTFTYDFNHSYVSSRLLLEGHNPYRTSLAAESDKFGFVHAELIPTATNPPLLLWLFAPLTMLPPRAAFWVWVGVEAVSLAIILWLTGHLLKGRLTPRGWRFLCAGVLASAPVFWHFLFSHVEMTLGAVLLAAYAWHKDGKQDRACWAVMLTGMTKIYPLMLLPWFVWRSKCPVWKRWRNAAGLLLGALAIIVVTDRTLWADFFQTAIPTIRWWSVGHAFNFTLPSFVINLGRVLWSGSAQLKPGRLWWAVGAGIGLSAILAAYAFCVTAEEDEDLQFSVLCLAMIAGGLTAWAYYFVLLIYPVGLAAARLSQSPCWRRAFAFAALLIAMNSQGPWDPSLWGRSPILTVLVNYLPLYGLVGLCFFLTRERRRA